MKEYEIGDCHSFRVKEAIAYGVESATLLQNIRFWCRTNMANKKHCYDGYYWTYNSAEAYSKLFPYIAPRTIANHLKKLVDAGILIKGDYSQDRYTRPNYYTIPSEFALQATNNKTHSNLPNEYPEFTKRVAENYQTTSANLPNEYPEFTNVNTDINTNVNPDINTDIKASARKKKTTDFDVKQWTNKNVPPFVNKEKWLQWQALRKSQRCSMTDSTLKRDLNVLIALWEQHQISSEIALDKAIKGKGGNGWQSLDIDYFDREIAKKAQQGIVTYAQQTAPPKQTKNQQAINRTLNAFDDFDNNFIDGGVL